MIRRTESDIIQDLEGEPGQISGLGGELVEENRPKGPKSQCRSLRLTCQEQKIIGTPVLTQTSNISSETTDYLTC